MRHWRDPSDRRGYHHGNLKEALVEAARRFIAERGIGGFTLADAAKLVGVTPTALYRHFRGRDALLAEVRDRGFAQLAERLGRSLGRPGTPIERFTRMGEAYLVFAAQEPGYYAAMFAPQPERDDEGRDVQSPRRDDAFKLLVGALESTFPAGFGTVDPRFLALEVWALSHGIATLAASGQLPGGPGLPDQHELLRAGIIAIVHGASQAQTPREPAK
jgi:AcrR family transcriptional regulator